VGIATGPIAEFQPIGWGEVVPLVEFEFDTAGIEIESHLHRNAAERSGKVLLKLEKHGGRRV
jgi:hypothetical protein